VAGTAAILPSRDAGPPEHADAQFAISCDFHREHGLRLWEARSELGWAEALADRGQPRPAREHATRALELSREHGYGAFEPRAAAILDALIGAGT
jgi:hypothetical protein